MFVPLYWFISPPTYILFNVWSNSIDKILNILPPNCVNPEPGGKQIQGVGDGVKVGVAVIVGVIDAVIVGVLVGVSVGVLVGVSLAVIEGVGVFV
jgi:hypothetical protein